LDAPWQLSTPIRRQQQGLVCRRCRRWSVFLFFFSSRRRHTRWPRDWSSDVCSSDLLLEELTSPLVPEVDIGRVLPREALIGPAHLARRGRRRDAQNCVVVATHRRLLLLVAQILEVGVDDFAFLRTRRALGRPARRARAGRLALRLCLAVHDLRELVRRTTETILGALHPLDILALQRFTRLGERVVDRLAIVLRKLGAALTQRALGRIHERVGLVAHFDLLLPLRVLGRIRLGL